MNSQAIQWRSKVLIDIVIIQIFVQVICLFAGD